LLLNGRIGADEPLNVFGHAHRSESKVCQAHGPARVSLQEPVGRELVAVGLPVCVGTPVGTSYSD
jgi:hypothetical protein